MLARPPLRMSSAREAPPIFPALLPTSAFVGLVSYGLPFWYPEGQPIENLNPGFPRACR
jgi:hypothetical protein